MVMLTPLAPPADPLVVMPTPLAPPADPPDGAGLLGWGGQLGR